MSSSKGNIIISENQLTDQIDTRYVLSYGHIPFIENERINYEVKLPLEQTVLIENLTGTSKTHDLYFQNCIFLKKIKVDDYLGLLYFDNCHFYSYVDFANAHFTKKIRFRKCTFEEDVYFNNTTFHDLADFWRCTFNRRTIFFKTDFLGTAVFSGTTFKKNVLFTYTLIGKLLILRGTTFKKGLDLSHANVSGDISLFDIRLKDYHSIDNKPNSIKFEKAIGEKGIIYTSAKRETYRIIKHNLLTKNDSVSSQKYSLLESVTHRKETWYNLKKSFSSNNFDQKWQNLKKHNHRKNLWDYALLTLNRASNKHKVSYVRGIAFTFTTGLLFFIIVSLSTETYSLAYDFERFNLGLAVGHYIQFLTPTHDFNFIEKNPPGWFYIFDFLGRIIIAYGIYQTIQAFRKYR